MASFRVRIVLVGLGAVVLAAVAVVASQLPSLGAGALLHPLRRHVDALVQAGTNLSMVSLADEAERWLGKPVIAINAAIWWMALRDNGIEDKVYGCGRLLRE